jgi:magnesium-transporting ATPase (P-type)
MVTGDSKEASKYVAIKVGIIEKTKVDPNIIG